MSEEKALTIVDQREVDFYGDALTAVKSDDGQVYAIISHMCRALEIDTQGQTRRIQRQPVLNDGFSWVDILSTQGPTSQTRRVQALRVDLVPLWLTGISTRSIKNDDIREKLEKLQKEAAKILWEAFQDGRLSTTEDDLIDLMQLASTETVETYRLLKNIVQLARNQIIFEAQTNQRLTRQDVRIDDHDKRLELIEAALGDTGRSVTQDQAMQISQAVKTIAIELGKQTQRNEFGAVYGEFYRQFGITSYKLLPARKFNQAMQFFTRWYQEITDESDVPF